MPRGIGRPVHGGTKKLLNSLVKSQKLSAQLRADPDPSTMHRGYEYERENKKTLDILGRGTDGDMRHRQTMAEIEQRQAAQIRTEMENRKRMAAGPSSNVSPIKHPRSRMNIKRYKV